MSTLPRETYEAMSDNTGEICDEIEGLRILDQFRKIYEDRMSKIEQDEARDTEVDFTPIKLRVMKEWIKDLGEQNIMLVRTVDELEQAACYRVKILEEKLRETAGIVSKKMSRLPRSNEDTVNNLSSRIEDLEHDEHMLQEKIEFLKSDIRGLLELIRRARCDNCWNLDGIKFFEIQPNDIPAPTECSCEEDTTDSESVESLKRRLEVLAENEKKARKYQTELQEKITELDSKLMIREETINQYHSMLHTLRENLTKHSMRKNASKFQISQQSGDNHESEIASIIEMVASAIGRSQSDHEEPEINEKLSENVNNTEVRHLRGKLEDKTLESSTARAITQRLSFLEKESKGTKGIVRCEGAEKHENETALRAQVAKLEEQCQQANMIVQYKENIIREMRRQLKQQTSPKETSNTGSSSRRVRIGGEVSHSKQREELSSQLPSQCNGQSSVASDLSKAKASWKLEKETLSYVRAQLEEVLEELHAKERQNYERDMASAQTKLNDIGTLLDNYRTEVIERKDTDREVTSDSQLTMHKLAKSIANISKVCGENTNGIALLERALQSSVKQERTTHRKSRDSQEHNERWKWDAFNRQLKVMEEFRVCTVEAQAAVENLREDMDTVITHIKAHEKEVREYCEQEGQLKTALDMADAHLHDMTKQHHEFIGGQSCRDDQVASCVASLKDIKNEMNRAYAEQQVMAELVAKIERVVDCLHELRKPENSRMLFIQQWNATVRVLQSQVNKCREAGDAVGFDNIMKVFAVNIPRLDKFEKELDYAHTKMQDTLEDLVQSRQRMIESGTCNLCSCEPSEDADMPETTAKHDEMGPSSTADHLEHLKNALRSKDKLIEDKDEIIKIQKDSITMTHVELKDLHQKMQSKIDAQNVAIAQHVEEKKLLLEQSKLQNQTIGHLREAVVEAKKSLSTRQQKSPFDLSRNNKDDIIRQLSLSLKETQRQYNDCFSEAAKQDTRLELQRQSIDNLQRKLICKDIVYYALLIKTQELFRGRIGDARLIRTKMDLCVKSKKSLEERCRKIKRLWRETDRELRRIKCITSYDTNCQQHVQTKDRSTWTDNVEFGENEELKIKIDSLLSENEDLKKQLENRRLDQELFDEEVKKQLIDDNQLEVPSEEASIKDDLRRRNVELDKLINEAKDKQGELEILQDMKKQFERTEYLERMNSFLEQELAIIRQTADNECSEEFKVNIGNIDNGSEKAAVPHDREIQVIKQLKDQLSSTREMTEDCLAELRVSREMLGFLKQRICSLKKLLKEKSDEMAELQADHQMLKNDYSILKTENHIFEEKACLEIKEFREKLKSLQDELNLVEQNYQCVSQDFEKSQEFLLEAGQRELKLQNSITAMEQIFYSKLGAAGEENNRLSEQVDTLKAELENVREELSTRDAEFSEKCRETCDQVEELEEQIARLENAKCILSRQLQDYKIANSNLAAENTRLKENGCRYVKKLEETQNALIDLKGECRTKERSLNSVAAELSHVAASRSELCVESHHVVACIREWIDEQRRLVENLTKKLKYQKSRIAQYAFEKKALVATVKELTRVNDTLSELSIRRKICHGQYLNRRHRCSTSNGYQSSSSINRTQKTLSNFKSPVHTRSFKKRCMCLTKTPKRSLLRGNSCWCPKLEHMSKDFCCSTRRYVENPNKGWHSETSTDEARDFGYQSSASK